jgi:glycerol-3-phosphate acyltransferase PlsY
MHVVVLICVLVVSYLIGAIPFGYLVVRLLKGIDIRQHGSGNIGATNVARVLGWRYFALVFVLDFLKGAGPVAIAYYLLPDQFTGFVTADELGVLAGLSAVIGHMWPIYLRFRGGKGVATSAGVVAVLLPIPMLAALAVFVLVLVVTRYVSASSISAALALLVARIIQTLPRPFGDEAVVLTIFCLLGALLIIFQHRANIVRLWQGTEPKVGQKKAPTSAADGHDA